MKSYKLTLFLILFLAIGFAIVSTTLLVNGNFTIGVSDDFDVYFSNAIVNGKQDLTIIESDKEMYFFTEFDKAGEEYKLEYDVTNASRNYEVEVEVNCTGGNDYVTLTNDFDTNTTLSARETRRGTLSIILDKSYIGDVFDSRVECTLSASQVESENFSDDIVPVPLEKCTWEYVDSNGDGELNTGDEYKYCSEEFNVVEYFDFASEVVLLAKYNLGTNYKQTEELNYVSFSNTNGWDYKTDTAPHEVDIQAFDGNAKRYVNNYVDYFRKATGYSSIEGNLISLFELGILDCIYPYDYAYVAASNRTCADSQYNSWLVNGQDFWTISVYTNTSARIWNVSPSGLFRADTYSDEYGIRPVLTVPIAALNNIDNKFKIGTELQIKGEKFNVITDNYNTVKLLAQYNLGTNYRQTSIDNSLFFSDNYGWEYSPGPKEIDIQVYDGSAKTYVNEYVEYLKEQTQDSSLTGDLITLTELGNLGCSYSSAYTYISDSKFRTCSNSYYKKWLLNGQSLWTKSAFAEGDMYIWFMNSSGILNKRAYNGASYGIRPTITLKKEYFNPYTIGKEVTIDGETFNVISSDDDTVMLLAQYNLGSNYKQSQTKNYLYFSDGDGWENSPGPVDIDIFEWSSYPKEYINEYVSYLRQYTGDNSITGNLITMKQLGDLGCTYPADYSSENMSNDTCNNSKYVDWLVNGQNWWTRSADGDPDWWFGVWYLNYKGNISVDGAYHAQTGIRPIIKMKKETYEKYYVS